MTKAKYKLELLRPAQRELKEIALVHTVLAGVESARKITDRIFRALEHLQSHLPMGVECGDEILRWAGYRMLICGHYLCIYRLLGKQSLSTILSMVGLIIPGCWLHYPCKMTNVVIIVPALTRTGAHSDLKT